LRLSRWGMASVGLFWEAIPEVTPYAVCSSAPESGFPLDRQKRSDP